MDKNEATWKCVYNRSTKDKPDNYKNFCIGTIKGFRDLFSKKYFNYYLKEEHSNICEDFENKLIHIKKYNDIINNKDINNNKILIPEKTSIDKLNKKYQIIKESINNIKILNDNIYKNSNTDNTNVNIMKENNCDMILNDKKNNELDINKSFINKAK